MPSLSPSPMKRPSLTERTSSNHSLSSSAKQTGPKAHRPHIVARGHGRNLSHGKNLSKLGRVNSSSNVTTDTGRQPQRKRSGLSSPPTSPRAPLVKRNSSHVTLPKNTSHGNLRKNHSATLLPRNVSHTALKKAGLPPAPKPKDKGKQHASFDLGDESADEEEDADWEDSTVSPELTRPNSKVSTPARAVTPNPDLVPQKPPGAQAFHRNKTSSPPEASLRNNRSAPNLAQKAGQSSTRPEGGGHTAALLPNNPRASRAPPVMMTTRANGMTGHLQRSNSSRSLTNLSYPSSSGDGSSMVDASGANRAVSHFLPSSTSGKQVLIAGDDGSDDDSTSSFMQNYHPLQPDSPEKSRTLGQSKTSRWQQRLELQRRETLRAGSSTSTTPPIANMGFSFASSASLHSRSGSRGRNRSLAAEAKAIRLDYEAAKRQYDVVRKFRNPVLESLARLKEAGVIQNDASNNSINKSRPQSRRGPSNLSNGHGKADPNQEVEPRKPIPEMSGNSSRRGSARVHFRRQGSHDDIGISRSTGSYEDNESQEEMSSEEALIRRIWNSRDVYDPHDGIEVR